MNKNKKYFIWPIGCAQNISDAERVSSVLESEGYFSTDKEEEADIICALACSVKQAAIDRILGRAKIWNKYNKNPLKILSGCVLPQDKPKMEEIFDIFFEINDLGELPTLVKQKQNSVIPIKIGIQEKNSENYFNYLSVKPKHTNSFQALVPIMNGCDNFCSYCAVPYTRGREVSRPLNEIISEVRDLVLKGYKEITLLGQNVNSYKLSQINTDLKQLDTEKASDFQILLEELNKIPGHFWIRFLSNHPKDFSEELIKRLPELGKVTPYIHLPVQSGSNEILEKMNRKYTKESFAELVEKIRKNNPDITITTDTIVGFPGETEKEFGETLDLYKKVKFDMAYISQYSPRKGTVSTKMKDDVSIEDKKRRDKKLNEILAGTAFANNEKYIGKGVIVLVEKEFKNYLWGRTDTYKLVKFKGDRSLIGNFTNVKIKTATAWTLEA